MSLQRAEDMAPRAAVLRARSWRGLALAFARRRLAYWRQLDVASGQAARLPDKVIWCDLAERLIVTSVFGSFAYRLFIGFAETANMLSVLLFLAELLPFIYIVLRAPSASLSQNPIDWGFGILGSVTPLLITPLPAEPLAPVVVCFALMLGGLLLQLSAKLVLGRAFGIIAANRGVRILGPYRFVRHPMYAGYTMTHVGFLLSMPLLINAALYGSVLMLQIVRIYREEKILMEDAGYRAFAMRVRYRLLPGVF